MSFNDYQMVSQRDSNGTFVAYLPAIKSCHALGQTREEAEQELKNVFDMISEEAIENGHDLPPDV